MQMFLEDMRDVRPGTSMRVVAGRNSDWLLHDWFGSVLIPHSEGDQRRHSELLVTATITRVHRQTEKEP
jgi:hypothetical protein